MSKSASNNFSFLKAIGMASLQKANGPNLRLQDLWMSQTSQSTQMSKTSI